MSTQGQSPATQGQRRAVDLSEQHMDHEWKQRWKAAKAKYPDDLIQYAGQVRGLFLSPDAPISAADGKVFIVYRTDPSDAAAGEVHVEGVYSNIPAANEHVLLCFAATYGDSMDERCSWSMKGVAAKSASQDLPPALGSVAEMVWSYTPHACLELEVISLPNDSSAGPRKVFIVEEWIEEEPPEDLELRVLGKRL